MRRRWRAKAAWLALAFGIGACVLGALAGGRSSFGQTGTATPAPGPEQPLANDDAVRLVLPTDIRNAGSDRLPVRMWARADMYGTSLGHVIFVTTIFPYTESDGTRDDRLVANVLAWNGTAWVPQQLDNTGAPLAGDNAWLAQNLTDISAYATGTGGLFTGFYATFSASGPYSAALTREETVVAVYDLAANQVWSRVVHLKDVDTSTPGVIATHAEDVDWSFKKVGNQPGIVANVTDTDTIALTGDASGGNLPEPGTTTTTATETYVFNNGQFVSLTPSGPPPQAAPPTTPAGTATPGGTPAPASVTPAPAVPTPTPGTPLCAAPGIIFPRGVTPIPTCPPTPVVPRAGGTPAG
jgi:hypothetical protein